MGKPQSKRTHKKEIDKQRERMTANQIREANNQTRKERNTQRRKERRKDAVLRQKEWRKLSPQEQLKELAKRPGNCAKQKARLLEKIEQKKKK